jgi:glycosyltransferase involved in cell wall biosynthesis
LAAFKLKISLVMTSKGLGGIQQCVVPYSLALRKLGYEIQILVLEKSGIVTQLAENNLDTHVVQLKRGWKLFRYLPNPELKRHIHSFGPDVVVGFAQLGFFEAERASRSLGVPVITHVGTMRIPRLRRFSKADGWLATTPEMKATLAGLGFPGERTFVVPNFLPENSRPRAPRELHAPPLVGSLGRFVPRKGFHVLIEAIALLHHRGTAVQCEIAGGGKTFPELARQIDAHGASSYIRLVGWLDKAAKIEFLQRIDLFVSPSLNEPFGIVYLDAMQVGAPVIATPTVGARYIFSTPGSAEFAPFDDPAALADAIGRVLANEEHRTALGVNAEQIYTARFGLDAGARHLEQALQQMVALKKK